MAPKKKAAAKAGPEDDYESLSAAQLKEKLKALGCTTGGSKEVLIERLRTVEAAEAEAGKPAPAPKMTAAAKRAAEKTEKEEAEEQAKKKAKTEDAPEPKAKAKAKGKALKEQKSEPQPEEPVAEVTGPSEVFFEDGQFKAEYAKSSRSTCNKCKKKIENDTLRLGKMVPSDKFDGMYPVWHHAQCFLAGGLLPRCTEQVSGFSTLRPQDQENISKYVPDVPVDVAGGGAAPVDQEKKEKIKKQNEKIYEILDVLKQLGSHQIDAMLLANGYPTQHLGGTTAKKEQLAADGIMFGATGKCAVCSDEKGHILLGGDCYRCRGYVNEFLKCTFRTQAPERTLWKMTSNASSIGDGRLTPTIGERLFSKVLTDKDADEESAPAQSSSASQELPPFLGLTFVVASKSDERTKEELSELIRTNGGSVADVVTRACSVVIATEDDAVGAAEGEESEATQHVNKAKELEIVGLEPTFLTDSVEKKERQDMKDYIVFGTARRWERTVEAVKTATFIKKRGVMMDKDVGDLKDKVHVLVELASKTVYSEQLSKTDLVTGANSYYTLHLLESDDTGNPEYWVFRKWGRIGVSQGGVKTEEFHGDKSKAIKAFSKLYLDKSGNEFGHARDAFVVKEGKMMRVDVQHEAIGDKKQKTEGDDAGDGEVDQPVGGNLSKMQIEKGDKVLDRIQVALDKAGGAALPAAAKAQLMGCSAEYYSLIPHNFGTKKPPAIDNAELLGAEKALLQFYLRMGFEDMEEKTDLTPIGGVMDLPLPKTLSESCVGICTANDVKSCMTKAAKLDKKKAGKPTAPLGTMGPEFYGAILLYTANAIYKDLNKCLRDEDRKLVSKYFPYLRLLFESCGRFPQRQVTLWRGVGVDLFDQYKVGSIIIWWGVSSCTSDEKVARNFMAGCGAGASLLTIETKTACDISELSFFQNEAESILLPGTQLEVLSSKKVGKKSEIALREIGRVVG